VKPLLLIGYAILVAVMGGLMAWRLSVSTPSPALTEAQKPTRPKGSDMQWSQEAEVVVPAKPTGVWTWAVDYVKGPARILIEADAKGTWVYSSGRPACGADGDLAALLSPASTILPSAPTGALLVKIGGSTAGATDGSVRVAGRKTYFEIDATVNGPMFLTINDELGGMSDNTGDLKVKISVSTIQATPRAPQAGAATAAPGAPPTEAPPVEKAAPVKTPPRGE